MPSVVEPLTRSASQPPDASMTNTNNSNYLLGFHEDNVLSVSQALDLRKSSNPFQVTLAHIFTLLRRSNSGKLPGNNTKKLLETKILLVWSQTADRRSSQQIPGNKFYGCPLQPQQSDLHNFHENHPAIMQVRQDDLNVCTGNHCLPSTTTRTLEKRNLELTRVIKGFFYIAPEDSQVLFDLV